MVCTHPDQYSSQREGHATDETHSTPCGVNADPLPASLAPSQITNYDHQETIGETRDPIQGATGAQNHSYYLPVSPEFRGSDANRLNPRGADNGRPYTSADGSESASSTTVLIQSLWYCICASVTPTAAPIIVSICTMSILGRIPLSLMTTMFVIVLTRRGSPGQGCGGPKVYRQRSRGCRNRCSHCSGPKAWL